MSDDLLYLTATEALARFADKSLSPVELLEAQIARAEAHADTINAFAYTHYGTLGQGCAGRGARRPVRRH